MTIYERIEKIQSVYIKNANACKLAGFNSAFEILMTDADILGEYIDNMPIGVAEMYAGENE
jgi:hypothetical protein